MKLNHDCIRDVLLYLEDELVLKDGVMGVVFSGGVVKQLTQKGHSADDILYSIKMLSESYLIDAKDLQANQLMYKIFDITPLGHEYIAGIRSPENWRNIKGLLDKLKNNALSVAFEVAKAYAVSKIPGLLG